MFTSMFQLLAVLALLCRILDADWSENDVLIGGSFVYYYGKALKSIARGLCRGVLRGPTRSIGALTRPFPANNYEWGPRGQNSGEPTETTWASPTFKFVSAWRMTQKRQPKTYFSHQGPPVGMPAFSPRSDALCGLCPRCAMLLQATASVVPRGLSRLHCVGCPHCARLPPTCAG